MRFLSVLSFSLILLLSGCLGDEGITFSEQLTNDIQQIDAYIASNGITAYKDVSGVRFSVQKLGTGYVPRVTDIAVVDYTGKFLDGRVFDSGTLNGPARDRDLPVSNLVPGFQIGLTQIPVGSEATFYIPSGYGYGQQGSSAIPANSILVFTVKLKSLIVGTTEKNRLGSDTVTIDSYLTAKAIANVVKDSSGLRYTVDVGGTGPVPSWYNKVKITYKGFILTNGEKGIKFYEGSNEPNNQTDSRVINFIRGFQMGLLKLQKGSKATFYIPSGLGFGPVQINSGTANVPANSNLIYEIELTDILAP